MENAIQNEIHKGGVLTVTGDGGMVLGERGRDELEEDGIQVI